MKTFEQHILDISGCPTIEIADNAVSRNTMLNWDRDDRPASHPGLPKGD